MTKGEGKWVHAPWDHKDEHVGVRRQRNGWSERLWSAFRNVQGQSSCVLTVDFSLTSNHWMVWVVHSWGSRYLLARLWDGPGWQWGRKKLCPMHPHTKQMDDFPSYWTGCAREPMRTLETRGESKSTWMQSLAKCPQTLSMVRASILRRLPNWFPIRWRMELS